VRFLLRRSGFYLTAAWASVTLAFIIPRLMPGDPATAMFSRFRGRLKPEALDALREAFGFSHAPLWKQYLQYINHTLHGDLGISIGYYPAPVGNVIAGALAWTLFLSGLAVILSFAAGTLLGLVAAWRRGGRLDGVALPVLTLLGAFPYFWLAMAVLFLFGFRLGWFPLRHAYDDALPVGLNVPFILSTLQHVMLPAATVVVATLGGWMLSMRSTVINVMAEDYVLFAQAKGLSEARIVLHYVARNALLPNLAGFGMALGFVLSGSLLTEIVFSYPGQGYLLVRAVKSLDYPLIQGLFLTTTFAVLAANWMVDVAHVWLDPRTRS
jgi:peptide/nickel transport system permease protein